jgi:hypothetical protein
MGIRNCLEIKYFAMMSQIDSFMSVNQFPLPLRKKMKEFYSYKYRQKYFNEDRIERFISGTAFASPRSYSGGRGKWE